MYQQALSSSGHTGICCPRCAIDDLRSIGAQEEHDLSNLVYVADLDSSPVRDCR